MEVSVQNISYGCISERRLKRILHNISFNTKRNDLCAILGPSGSGKSTLLDLISNRKSSGKWSGDIIIDGQRLSQVKMEGFAYVPQKDFCHPNLTVEESLQFAAWVKLPSSCSKIEIEERVHEILTIFGLVDIRHSFVGNNMNRGISGGQLKRLSIGIEIIGQPPLILIDEPTSGLDSVVAYEVMKCIKMLSMKGHNCITTIHQPSVEIFNLIDNVVLLSEGRLIFTGETSQISSYFTSPSLGYSMISYQNPAEFILDIASGNLSPNSFITPRSSDQLSKLFYSFSASAKHSSGSPIFQTSHHTSNTHTVTNGHHPIATVNNVVNSHGNHLNHLNAHVLPVTETASSPSVFNPITTTSTKYLRQLQMLLVRDWLISTRDKNEIQSNIIKNIIIGCLTSALFWKDADVRPPFFTPEGLPLASINSICALIYFTMIFTFLGNTQIIVILCERHRIHRYELSANYYTTLPYWITACVIRLPLLILTQSILFLIFYFACGFPMSLSYICYFYSILFLSNLNSFYVAQYLAAFTKSPMVAFSIFPIIFVFLCNFAGYSVNLKTIPIGWSWAKYVSFARWIYEGLIVNEFEQFQDFVSSFLPGVTSGGLVLDMLGFHKYNKYDTYWIMGINIAISMMLMYISFLPSISYLHRVEAEDLDRDEMQYSKSYIEMRLSSKRSNSIKLQSQQKLYHNRLFSYFQRMIANESDLTEDLLPFSSSAINSVNEGAGEALTHGNRNDDFHLPIYHHESYRSALLSPSNDQDLDYSNSPNIITNSLHTSTVSDNNHTNNTPYGLLSSALHSSTDNLESPSNIQTSLLFYNISYSVSEKHTKQKKQILNNVSGVASPGHIVAILGPSGSGKSTLLDILAGRKTVGSIAGRILMNGRDLNKYQKRLSTAYVMQDNVHIGTFTVLETLQFAANLRLDSKLSRYEKDRRIKSILSLLGLTDHIDTRVGTDRNKGLSGGQLKRLSIGVEMMSLPSLIFLDEPTTGLDSSTSLEIMSVVRRLANQNRTILCSIHQPSPQIYSYFDTILLLSKGQVIYFGVASGLKDFFLHSKFRFQFPINSNPAEFALSIASLTALTSPSSHTPLSSNELATYYTFSNACKLLMESLESTLLSHPLHHDLKIPEGFATKLFHRLICYQSPHPTSMFHQVFILCYRVLLQNWKSPRVIVTTTLRHILISLFYGSLYWQISRLDDSPPSYANRFSIFFFSITFMIMGHQLSIPSIFESRLLFYRERGAGLYGALPYFISSIYLKIFFSVIDVAIFTGIIYFMVGFEFQTKRLLLFYTITFLQSLTGMFVSQLIAALSPTSQVAINFFPVCLFISLAFAGYMRYLPSFPTWCRIWLPYLSFIRWGFQALVLNELEGNESLSYRDYFIQLLGFDDFSKEECVAFCMMFLSVFAIFVLIALHFISFENR